MKVFKMFKTILMVFIILFTTACSTPNAPITTPVTISISPTPQQSITILAFGDSLTEGFGVDPVDNYPSQLERKLLGDGYAVKVINGGISGETSTSALGRIDWMLKTQPDIVIVETGGNDALRGLSLELTQQNIDEIVRKFTDSGVVVVVAGLQIIQNLGQVYTTEFAAIYPAVADKYDAILIPFMLEGVATDPNLNQPDFIHPNAHGYKVIVDHIYPYILESLERIQNK